MARRNPEPGEGLEREQSAPRPRTAVDLEIRIRREGATLHFEVHSSDPDSGINPAPMISTLGTEPSKFFHSLFTDIGGLPLKTEAQRQTAGSKLKVRGLKVWALFPRELQEILWKRRGKALTLLIQSDEPHIPWEIAKLQSPTQGRRISGPFLCEAFALTRWLKRFPHRIRLPLESMALVAPLESDLPQALQERDDIAALASKHGRQVQVIDPPRRQPVLDALASGSQDGWHFTGHGTVFSSDPDGWSLLLDGQTELAAEDLLDEAVDLQTARPLVFLNGCSTGRGGFTLTGPGGWSERSLEAGAGAFLGTYWAISDSKARELAVTVYKGLFSGLPIGEAVRQARLRLHKKHKGDLTWLAYTIFAHPMATCGTSSGETSLRKRSMDRKPSQLTIPIKSWRQTVDPPGALLRAQYAAVPFHRREKEFQDLQGWCRDPAPVRVRLYTGPGGMGKTRLALEAAWEMKKEGWWTGFVTKEALRSPEKTWQALARPEAKILLIVDYAETHRDFLIPVLRQMYDLKRGPVRLLLLARAALDWWEQLKSEREGVGELLSGPATSRVSLAPLADSVEARAESYDIAAEAFSRVLAAAPGERPHDLKADHYQRVLLLHMKALIDLEVEGQEKAQREADILDRILARERWHWEARSIDWGLSAEIVPGISRALAAITLGGGVQGETEALEVLRHLRFFGDQPPAVLTRVAHLLHECYPGERWIEPIQPDLLGEHLVQRELEKGADELFDLVLGPQSGG